MNKYCVCQISLLKKPFLFHLDLKKLPVICLFWVIICEDLQTNSMSGFGSRISWFCFFFSLSLLIYRLDCEKRGSFLCNKTLGPSSYMNFWLMISYTVLHDLQLINHQAIWLSPTCRLQKLRPFLILSHSLHPVQTFPFLSQWESSEIWKADGDLVSLPFNPGDE